MNKSSSRTWRSSSIVCSSSRFFSILLVIIVTLTTFIGCDLQMKTTGSVEITLAGADGTKPTYFTYSLGGGEELRAVLDSDSSFILSDLQATKYSIDIKAYDKDSNLIGRNTAEFNVEAGKVTVIDIKCDPIPKKVSTVFLNFKSISLYDEADTFIYTVKNSSDPDDCRTYKVARPDMDSFSVKLEEGEWLVTLVPMKGEEALGVKAEEVKVVTDGTELHVDVDAIKYNAVTISALEVPESANTIIFEVLSGQETIMTMTGLPGEKCAIKLIPGNYSIIMKALNKDAEGSTIMVGDAQKDIAVIPNEPIDVEIKCNPNNKLVSNVNIRFNALDKYPEADSILVTIANKQDAADSRTYLVDVAEMPSFHVSLENGKWNVSAVPMQGENALGVSLPPVEIVTFGRDVYAEVGAIKYSLVTVTPFKIPATATSVVYELYKDGVKLSTKSLTAGESFTDKLLPGNYSLEMTFTMVEVEGSIIPVATAKLDFTVEEYLPFEEKVECIPAPTVVSNVYIDFQNLDNYSEADCIYVNAVRKDNPEVIVSERIEIKNLSSHYLSLEKGYWTITAEPSLNYVSLGEGKPVEIFANGSVIHAKTSAIKYSDVKISVKGAPDSTNYISYVFFKNGNEVAYSFDVFDHSNFSKKILPGKYTVKITACRSAYVGQQIPVTDTVIKECDVVENKPFDLTVSLTANPTSFYIRRPSNLKEAVTRYVVTVKNIDGTVVKSFSHDVATDVSTYDSCEVEPGKEYLIGIEAFAGNESIGNIVDFDKAVKPITSISNDISRTIRYDETWSKIVIHGVMPTEEKLPGFSELIRYYYYTITDPETGKVVREGYFDGTTEEIRIEKPAPEYEVKVDVYRNPDDKRYLAGSSDTHIWKTKEFMLDKMDVNIKARKGEIWVDVTINNPNPVDFNITIDDEIYENKSFVRHYVDMGTHKVSGMEYMFLTPEEAVSGLFSEREVTVYPGEITEIDVVFEPIKATAELHVVGAPDDTAYYKVSFGNGPEERLEVGQTLEKTELTVGKYEFHVTAYDAENDKRGDKIEYFKILDGKTKIVESTVPVYVDPGTVYLTPSTDHEPADSYRYFCKNEKGEIVEKDTSRFSLDSGLWEITTKGYNKDGKETCSASDPGVNIKTGIERHISPYALYHETIVNFEVDVPESLRHKLAIQRFNTEKNKWETVCSDSDMQQNFAAPGMWSYRAVVKENDGYGLIMAESETFIMNIERGLSHTRSGIVLNLHPSHLKVDLSSVNGADAYSISSTYTDLYGKQNKFTSPVVAYDKATTIDLPAGNHQISVEAMRNNILIARSSSNAELDILPGKSGEIVPFMDMIPYKATIGMAAQELPTAVTRYVFSFTDGNETKNFETSSNIVKDFAEGTWRGTVKAYDSYGLKIGWTDSGISFDAKWGETGSHAFELKNFAVPVDLTFSELSGAGYYLVTIDEDVKVPYTQAGTYRIHIASGLHNIKVTAYESEGGKLLSETMPYDVSISQGDNIRLEWNGSASFTADFMMPERYEGYCKASFVRWTLSREGEQNIVIEQHDENKPAISQNIKPGLWNVIAESFYIDSSALYRKVYAEPVTIPEKIVLEVPKTVFLEKEAVLGVDGTVSLDFRECFENVDIQLKFTNVDNPAEVIEQTIPFAAFKEITVPSGYWTLNVTQKGVSGSDVVRIYPGTVNNIIIAPSGADLSIQQDEALNPTPVLGIVGGKNVYVAGENINLTCNHESMSGSVAVSWYLDSSFRSIGNGDVLSFDSTGLADGKHRISAKVVEPETGRLVMIHHEFTVTR